jgi:hypothetical protein
VHLSRENGLLTELQKINLGKFVLGNGLLTDYKKRNWEHLSREKTACWRILKNNSGCICRKKNDN